MKVPKLENKKLILRKFSLKDINDLLELKNRRVKNKRDAEKFIKNSVSKTNFYLAVFLKEENKVIGHVELCHLDWWDFDAGEIAYHFNKKYWGQGYATESARLLINYCFKKLKLHKVYADTDQNNLASQRVLAKLGFKLEGRIRDRRKIKGKWVDEFAYGLLKKEWSS